MNIFDWKKKRGRPVMDEVFFYDPYEKEHSFFIGVDTGIPNIGDYVAVSTGETGYVSNIVNSSTLEINWSITYKE